MCRLLGVVSRQAITMVEALGQKDADAFAALSAKHKDGWGLVTDAPGRLRTSSGTTRASDDAAFAAASEAQRGTALALHFRLASPGTVVGPRNLHPFSAHVAGIGPVALAHNGHFFDVPAVREAILPRVSARPQGTTDSEVYALYVFELLRQGVSPRRALAEAATLVNDVSDVVALNTLLLTPTALHAMQWHDPTPRSDGFAVAPRAASFQMRLRAEREAVTVCSNEWEPSDGRWEDAPEREVLTVDRAGVTAEATSVAALLHTRAA